MSREFVKHSLAAAAIFAAFGLLGCGSSPSAPAQPIVTPYDGAAPAAPTGVTTALDSYNTRILKWNPGAESDLASYQVYQYSPAPNRDNAYVLVATRPANAPFWVLPTPADEIVTWLKVCAVDATGNVSAESAPYLVTLAQTGVPEQPPTDEQPRLP